MKQLSLLLSFLIVPIFSFSQQNLVPAAYESIGEAVGDLDKDGIDEKAVVYTITNKEKEEGGHPREIIIFKKKDKDWIIWHRSVTAVLGSEDGGMMGDPFEGVKIEKG